jgi:RNA polymerase sigma-70 factor (ECF subfamily)
MSAGDTTRFIGNCLARLAAGDLRARSDLLTCAEERLEHLTRKMLRGDFARLRRWEETSDVYQSALLRLHRALEQVIPESPLHFYRISAQLIRRELLDLARHYFGPEGPAAHHASGALTPPTDEDKDQEPADRRRDGGGNVEELYHLHEQVDRLSEPERTVVDLLIYQELSQAEAAAVMGVDVRSVQRYWQKARLLLHQALREGKG